MGNIQMEVRPTNCNSRRRKESKAVKRISMHQPVSPQSKKSFFMGAVFHRGENIYAYSLKWMGKNDIMKIVIFDTRIHEGKSFEFFRDIDSIY